MQRRKSQIQPANLKKKAIGVVVSEFRREAGFSQERLSADCGFERTYLSRVERGILNPTAIRLWNHCRCPESPVSRDGQPDGELGRRAGEGPPSTMTGP
jgi:transcriptional regulator with XRE-family HTH domain